MSLSMKKAVTGVDLPIAVFVIAALFELLANHRLLW